MAVLVQMVNSVQQAQSKLCFNNHNKSMCTVCIVCAKCAVANRSGYMEVKINSGAFGGTYPPCQGIYMYKLSLQLQVIMLLCCERTEPRPSVTLIPTPYHNAGLQACG